ncbi:MAG: DUF2779 domain-containing protein [Methanobrevibacter sp.]|uniref:DUF2779 domain-containing protein n=1 Tax=Methanobrevibacter sp. TaxID=66852 RepID=UPI001B1085EF|nr:DUF2779 domain-containing protein [Methanobrevibacter sp.]MBO5151241.1 DUF2779 domain-containing protein [Methanobrevibacter sp.]
MSEIHLSKSRYCRGVQCEKILWLEKYKPDSSADGNDAVLEKGREVGELAKGLFGEYEDIPFGIDLTVSIEKTDELLQNKPNVITEASFSYENNFCSVDILKNDADGVEIYEVKSSTKIDEVYIDDASYQYFVLSNLGLNVKKISIVYINNEYIMGNELELDRLFKIEDVTSEVIEKQDEIKSNIEFLNEFMKASGSEPEKDIGMHCFKPYRCAFWDYCTRDLPKPNVFDIAGMFTSKKLEKYYDGKISFEDLKNEKLNLKYLEQIDFELNDLEPKINRKAIGEVLDSLNYPLYFIDYESCQYAVPEYAGTKPYQQIPFQYSLHIINKKDAPLEHKEFLAEADDMNIIRNFAESMIRDMPENGSVIVYNKAFEATRNKEIARMYPDLADEMKRFNDNMVDLMIPFKNRDYYTKEMKGSYSIKYVLPALYPDDPELDYSELSLIHKGDEASNAFLSLNDKTPEEQAKIRKALLEYCKLDTYAMVKIWENFNSLI